MEIMPIKTIRLELTSKTSSKILEIVTDFYLSRIINLRAIAYYKSQLVDSRFKFVFDKHLFRSIKMLIYDNEILTNLKYNDIFENVSKDINLFLNSILSNTNINFVSADKTKLFFDYTYVWYKRDPIRNTIDPIHVYVNEVIKIVYFEILSKYFQGYSIEQLLREYSKEDVNETIGIQYSKKQFVLLSEMDDKISFLKETFTNDALDFAANKQKEKENIHSNYTSELTSTKDFYHNKFINLSNKINNLRYII